MVPADASFLWYWYWYSLFLSPTECGRSCLQQEHDAPKNDTVHVSKQQLCLIQQMPLLSPYRQLISGYQKSLTPSYQ